MKDQKADEQSLYDKYWWIPFTLSMLSLAVSIAAWITP